MGIIKKLLNILFNDFLDHGGDIKAMSPHSLKDIGVSQMELDYRNEARKWKELAS